MFNTKIIITNIAGSLIDTVEVGVFKTLKTAYKNAIKKSNEIEQNYSTWSNYEIQVNGKECYENMEDQLVLGR